MPIVLAYILDNESKPLPEREAVIRDYATDHLPHLDFPGCYVDPARLRSKPIFRRPSGNQLRVDWRRGDHVILDDSALAFASGRDFRSFVACMRGIGVVGHFLDFGIVSTDERAVELLLKSQSLTSKRQSIRSKETHERNRQLGRRTNQHCRPGYQWAWNQGWHRTIDADQWADVQSIVRLRRQGLSWKRISHAMTQAECELTGRPFKLMTPRTWTDWRCRQAVEVYDEWERNQAGTTQPEGGES
jgi:hypothetical protein